MRAEKTMPPGSCRIRSWRGTLFSRAFLAAILACSLSRTTPPATAAEIAGVSKEYQIKAAFLYNITKFVEWPAERLPAPDSPIVIGVLGKNPFANELVAIAQDHQVNRHPIRVVPLQSAQEVAGVHLLFVPAGEENLLGDLRRWPTGVLAVGETERFAKLGAIVFGKASDRVRLEIDVTVAESAGLKISAQLLKLAATVRR